MFYDQRQTCRFSHRTNFFSLDTLLFPGDHTTWRCNKRQILIIKRLSAQLYKWMPLRSKTQRYRAISILAFFCTAAVCFWKVVYPKFPVSHVDTMPAFDSWASQKIEEGILWDREEQESLFWTSKTRNLLLPAKVKEVSRKTVTDTRAWGTKQMVQHVTVDS